MCIVFIARDRTIKGAPPNYGKFQTLRVYETKGPINILPFMSFVFESD